MKRYKNKGIIVHIDDLKEFIELTDKFGFKKVFKILKKREKDVKNK